MSFTEPWMDEKSRIQPRLRVLFMSTIDVRGIPMSCKVRDLSVNGALVETALTLWVNTEVVLHLPKLGAVHGDIIWVNGGRAGVAFKMMIDPLQLKEMLNRPVASSSPDPARWQPKANGTSLEVSRTRNAISRLREQAAQIQNSKRK
jgi:PilZ domain